MDNRKIVVAFYLFVSGIFWGLVRTFLHFIHSKSYEFRSLLGDYSQWFLEGAPILIALGTFLFLSRYQKANSFFDECVTELRKVTWPSRDDVVRSTIVVMLWIVISSLILGGFDAVFGEVVTYLLKA